MLSAPPLQRRPARIGAFDVAGRDHRVQLAVQRVAQDRPPRPHLLARLFPGLVSVRNFRAKVGRLLLEKESPPTNEPAKMNIRTAVSAGKSGGIMWCMMSPKV